MTNSQETKRNRSPLGEASAYYRTKRPEQGSILDNPEKGMLEFYPAGSTKPSTQGGTRQAVLKTIYEYALSTHAEDRLFPFGKKGHHVVLKPQHNNKHDPHAVLLTLSANQDNILYACDGKDIGYVPRRISKLVHINHSCIFNGVIYKIKSQVYGKYYQIKVALFYGDELLRVGGSTSLARFVSLVED